MGRFSPTVTASPQPTLERGALTRIVSGYYDAKDTAEDRKERRADREYRKTRDKIEDERAAKREERETSEHAQRQAMETLRLALQGIVKDAPAESGNLGQTITPPPSNMSESITPFNPAGARPPQPAGVGLEQAFNEHPEAMSHEQAPPTAMAAPQQPQPKPPAAPGAFDPATGQFSRPQRIPLGGGYSYDPALMQSMTSAKMGPELAEYREKKKIDKEFDDPPAYQPRSQEEWRSNQSFLQSEQLKYSRPPAGRGGSDDGLLDDQRADGMAREFANRHVQAHGGNVGRAVASIEANPQLKAQAQKYGLTLNHYNAAYYDWAKDQGVEPQEATGHQRRAGVRDMVTGQGAARPKTAPGAPKAPPPTETIRPDKVQLTVQVMKGNKGLTAADVDAQVKRGRITAAEAAEVKRITGVK